MDLGNGEKRYGEIKKKRSAEARALFFYFLKWPILLLLPLSSMDYSIIPEVLFAAKHSDGRTDRQTDEMDYSRSSSFSFSPRSNLSNSLIVMLHFTTTRLLSLVSRCVPELLTLLFLCCTIFTHSCLEVFFLYFLL